MIETAVILAAAAGGGFFAARSIYQKRYKELDAKFMKLLGEATELAKQHITLQQRHLALLKMLHAMGLHVMDAGGMIATEPEEETPTVTKTEGNVIHVDFKNKTKTPTLH